MPFKSKAQRRKFAEMLVKGEISPETFEEWNRETGDAELPERVERKRSPKKARARSKKRGSVRKKGSRAASRSGKGKRAAARKSERKSARKSARRSR